MNIIGVDKSIAVDVQKRLNRIGDDTLTRIFSDDETFRIKYLKEHDLFIEKAKSLKMLFPVNYNYFKQFFDRRDVKQMAYYHIFYLCEMLFIEYAHIDFSRWDFLDKHFTIKGQQYNHYDVSTYMVALFHHDAKILLDKFVAYPLAGKMLLPIILKAAVDDGGRLKNKDVCDRLIECVKSAGLEDSLRYSVFAAFLRQTNINTLRYFVKAVEDNKLTRFKSLREALALYDIDHQLNYTSEEYIRLMRAVVDNNYDKYMTGSNGTYRLLTAHMLLKYRTVEFAKISEKYIKLGDELVRRTILYIIGIDRYSSRTGIFYYIVSKYPFSLDEYTAFFHCFRYDGRNGLDKNIFNIALRIYDKMPKANYSVAATDSFPITTSISKSDLAGILIEIAKKTGKRRMVAKLDKRYDSFPTQAQSRFVTALGDKTSLNLRYITVGLLKHENSIVIEAFQNGKIKLTYREAVRVSDFLKSKKQDIKNSILKEFLRSPAKKRICKYLCGCTEQYKREIGDEMKKTLNSKMDKMAFEAPQNSEYAYAYNNRSVLALERPRVSLPEYKTRLLEQMSPERVKYIFNELLSFRERNKNYEYCPKFYSTLITIGSEFREIDGGNVFLGDDFSNFPLEDELEAIFKTLSPVEISELYLLSSVFSNNPGGYANCHIRGKTLDVYTALRNKYPRIESEYLKALVPISVKRFVDEDTAIKYLACLCERHAFKSRYNKPYAILEAALNSNKNINILTMLWLSDLDIHPENDNLSIDIRYGVELFAKAYERRLVSPEYIEYRLTNCSNVAHFLTDRDEKNKYYMYAEKYKYPRFREFYKAIIDKFVNCELERGTLKTPYTDVVRDLKEIYGAEIFAKAIVKARGITLVRNNSSYWYGSNKNELISKILKTVRPAEDDKTDKFCAILDKYAITDDELIRAAVYNLNFLNLASERLNIPGFKSAVLYFAAHLNENLSESRIEKIKEYSTIDYHDFKDGAFDFDWYENMINTVPPESFKKIYKNAKYITVAGLHKRAQRFFDAISGKITVKEAKEHILASRNKDFCLIYSLIPLADEHDLLERYAFYMDFIKESKNYGSQRQLSERRTVDIAFENLARNAGYADSSVFIYEMESRDRRVIDMYEGVNIGNYTLKLGCSLDRIKLLAFDNKSGKKLSSVPASIAKIEQTKEITEYKKSEEAKRKRLKRSLEDAMENQTAFTAEQIQKITAQPLIREFFSHLILTDGERAYILKNGNIVDIATDAATTCKNFTVAHPITLRKIDMLKPAMRYIIDNNLKQPFKQVFREMYIMSESEKDATEILRYKGFNVDLKKAVAALKSRGWGVSEDIGLRKVYYTRGTIAAIFREFDYYYIYDFDNENRELESIVFIDRNDFTIKAPSDVDDVVFSETLRDVDLMIAISAQSTYDYELSMSTFEVRRAMIETITELLSIKNVSFLKENIKVAGAIGTYIINIRTGLVFKEGKGNLLLKTIENYDKPIALDFIDEDPMTADIVTKALVLSDDIKIKDPAILKEIAG